METRVHFLLERSSRADVASAQRWALDTGAFDGVVVPDVPSSVSMEDAERGSGETRARWTCRTTSGTRGARDATARAFAHVERAVREGTNVAILCVSGDDGASGTSEAVLRALARARARGEVPKRTTLLAAVNPMLGAVEAERVLRKRECGADGFITQPTLGMMRRFDAWREACERARVWDGLEAAGEGRDPPRGLYLGVAAVRDARGLEFWFKLTGVDSRADDDARALVEEYATRAKTMSPERFDAWTFERLELATTHAASVDAAAGVHVMPITAGGYVHAARLAETVIPSFK